ncbi:hypothetical protein Rumeso_02273 [Rubellimicrobium mesophilum DSM 19309]|uniref:J domain-containing protein n=1 Tax=Rubellimicrobium mesophilum DSM 19309 TaxID=442562 RepID=A0A017HQS5_9RHOB|nr:hypothetical protein [Rubellimicrobium mesophilum]EYD76084.1 hypothetical protein Rumeso_02273 [Rubellimicrobium mesophilum DSM 19309]
MFDRPHRLVSVADLRALAQARWQDRAQLDAIARELSTRPGTAASLLLGSVQARLREMPADGPTERLARELEESRARARRAESDAARLRQDLAAARAGRTSEDEVARLSRQLDDERWRRLQAVEEAARLRQQVEALAPGASQTVAAYAELHLLPDIPDDLLDALQNAYRKHLHPDRVPARDRDAATRRFQSAERAFAAIREARGL